MSDPLRQLALRDGRYSPEAFRFLFESLDYAVRLAGKEEAEGTARHVTGQEVLSGMRAYALDAFGPLAAHVWRSWGVRESLDWGRIVFLLVDEGMLKRQDGDTIADFESGFDFDQVFVEQYRPQLPVLGAAGEGQEDAGKKRRKPKPKPKPKGEGEGEDDPPAAGGAAGGAGSPDEG